MAGGYKEFLKDGDVGTAEARHLGHYFVATVVENGLAACVFGLILIFFVVGCIASLNGEAVAAVIWDAFKLCLGVFLGMLTNRK